MDASSQILPDRNVRPQGSLLLCLLGDETVDHSAFLRCARGEENPHLSDRTLESHISLMHVDGVAYRVRFVDNIRKPSFLGIRGAVLGTAHAILLCFSVEKAETLAELEHRCLPLLQGTGSLVPAILVGLCREPQAMGSPGYVSRAQAVDFSRRHGTCGYLECSILHAETVEHVLAETLIIAKQFYSLQWQLGPRKDAFTTRQEDLWLNHETATVKDDSTPLDTETVKANLSMLGITPTRQHAYLRVDLQEMGLTSLDAIRPFQHLQFLNVSGNRLHSLEPIGDLRCLLHMNASCNFLIRTQGFAQPDQLETIDLSYNLIGELGDWKGHKYLRELNLRANFIHTITPGLQKNRELRMLDISENYIAKIENLEGLDLRVLLLAQNRLHSLEGISSLGKLQKLNVRHNCITSVAALRSEDTPRLRELCISENRISRIDEVQSLQSFDFLCDLQIFPNPVVQLPHYRAQILHRLPNLRVLDVQAATAEEKVKADVIYGQDVERRKDQFQQLLAEEAFVDRRLVTKERIEEMEQETFGQQGDAGEFGRLEDANGREGSRTPFQESMFRRLVESARKGGCPKGVADFSTFPAPFVSFNVYDNDLPEILEAVAEGGIEQLLLRSTARISLEGLEDIISVLDRGVGELWYVDISNCPAVLEVGNELLDMFPYGKGCSMETSGCGLDPDDVAKLRNQTKHAESQQRRRAQERERTHAMCANYLEQQEMLEAYADQHRTGPGPPVLQEPCYHPKRWIKAPDGQTRQEHTAYQQSNSKGVVYKPDNLFHMLDRNGVLIRFNYETHEFLQHQRTTMFELFGVEDIEGEDRVEMSAGLPPLYKSAFYSDDNSWNCLIGFMVWIDGLPPKHAVEAHRERVEEQARLLREEEARKQREYENKWARNQKRFMQLTEDCARIHDGGQLQPNMGSGQIIAHFTYLCAKGTWDMREKPPKPKLPTDFGLKDASTVPRPRPRHGYDFYAAVAEGAVVIESVTGCGFLAKSITLQVMNATDEELHVTVQRGTIFQHITWEHRQNLMIELDYVLKLGPGMSVTKQMSAYCMNLSCACSSGNPMALTKFYLDDDCDVLEGQGRVWDYFEGCFNTPVSP